MRNLVLICALALAAMAQSPAPQATGVATPVITITRAGVLTLDGREVNIRQLNASLERLPAAAQGVYIRADRDVSWEAVSQVLSELKTAKPPVPVKLVNPR